MSKQERQEIKDILDGCLKIDQLGNFSFDDENFSKDDVLKEFTAIKIKYNCDIDYINYSDDCQSINNIVSRLMSKDINCEKEYLLEDLETLLINMACSFYKKEFLDELDSRADELDSDLKIDIGFINSMDIENGEKSWIKGDCL